MIPACDAAGCDASAVWLVHPLPLDDDDPRTLLLCDEHATAVPVDPDRPARGIG